MLYVAEMIVLLASLYRSIVREQNFISIRKEINTCCMYLNIFSLRYANKLNYEIDVDRSGDNDINMQRTKAIPGFETGC
jgi:sensor histidine kinase YesM